MSNAPVEEDLYDAYRFHEAKLAELRKKLKGTAFYARIAKTKMGVSGGVTKKKKKHQVGRTKKRKEPSPKNLL
jgi:hypothetical protein